MPITFSVSEAFEMAQQIERNGAKFYRKAAETNSAHAPFLNELAEQEDAHLATFTQLKNDLSERDSESTAFDPDGQSSLYLKEMAGGHVFDVKKDPSDMLNGDETIEQIVKIAIGLEKESIVFYTGLRTVTPRKLGKEKLDLIINEELRHITWLSQKLTS